MCINFIDFNNVVIHGRPKDTREIWTNQEKSITQSAIERIVDKLIEMDGNRTEIDENQ